MSIFLGHALFFITDIYPKLKFSSTKKDIFDTPKFMVDYLTPILGRNMEEQIPMDDNEGLFLWNQISFKYDFISMVYYLTYLYHLTYYFFRSSNFVIDIKATIKIKLKLLQLVFFGNKK